MKKIIILFLLSILLPSVSHAIPKTESTTYPIQRLNQIKTTLENYKERLDTYQTSMEKFTTLGDPSSWLSSLTSFFSLPTVSKSVVKAFSSSPTGGTGKNGGAKFPEGKAAVQFFQENLFPPDGENAQTGFSNVAKINKNREIAVIEMGTYGLARGYAARAKAARNIAPKGSSSQKTTDKINTSRSYGQAVARHSVSTMNTAQIYNELMHTIAINNMISAAGRTEQLAVGESLSAEGFIKRNMGGIAGGLTNMVGGFFE